MATVSTVDPEFQAALEACVEALQRTADYELEPSLDRRIRELGERKEFLDAPEHEELLELVEFTQQRTNEKLGAQVALQRLRQACPELFDDEQ